MLGELDKCMEFAQKAIELDPNFPVAYHNLALALFEKKDYQAAIENCDKAAALGFDVPEGFLKEIAAHR